MLEMWGACGIEPWSHTWREYRRIFTGWRRYRWEFTGHICVVTANGLLPRKDRRSWQLSDFTNLVKAPAKWKARITAAAGLLKALFCGGPPPESKDDASHEDDPISRRE